jgi:pimeloyl-ACP methyl ester carboxylesterase
MSSEAIARVIDYDLTDGIEVLSRCFTPATCGQGEDLESLAFVPPEEYNMPPSVTDPDVVAILKQFEHPYMGGPKGRQVAYNVLGDDSESDQLTAFFMNWGRHRDEVMAREVAGIMRRNPGMRLLVSDHPNTGRSDALPEAAAHEVADSGRHAAFAEIVLGGLKSVFDDYVPTIRGRSQGGLVGLEVAAQLNKPVKAMSVFDSPGSRELRVGDKSKIETLENIARLRGMARFFLKNEALHVRAYADAPCFDTETARLRKEGTTRWEAARAAAEMIRERRFMAQCIWLPLSMAKGKINEAIEAAMANVQDTMTFISPLHSELNNPTDVEAIFEDIVDRTEPARLPRIVRQFVINGTHAFGTSTPDALTTVENYGLYGTAVHEH